LPNGDEFAGWNGKEVTAACLVGTTIVCAALDGVVYIVKDGNVEKLKHKLPELFVYAAAPVGRTGCLFGGQLGQLVTFDIETGQFRNTALREHGIFKPGRKILGMHPSGDDIFIIGSNELVVRYSSGTFASCINGPPKESLFFCAARTENILWIGGIQDASGRVVECDLKAGTLAYCDSPSHGNRAPALAALNGKLFAASGAVFCRTGPEWLNIGDFGEDSIIRLVPAPNDPQSILAVGFTGRTQVFPIP
jgi:hypothetical protein